MHSGVDGRGNIRGQCKFRRDDRGLYPKPLLPLTIPDSAILSPVDKKPPQHSVSQAQLVCLSLQALASVSEDKPNTS